MRIKPLVGYVVCKKRREKITIYNSDVQDAIHFTKGYAICLRNRLNEIYAYKKEEYFVRKAELRVIGEKG